MSEFFSHLVPVAGTTTVVVPGDTDAVVPGVTLGIPEGKVTVVPPGVVTVPGDVPYCGVQLNKLMDTAPVKIVVNVCLYNLFIIFFPFLNIF